MKKLKALILLLFSSIALSLSFSSKRVDADMGPKPTLQITVSNLDQSDYIVAFGTKYEGYYGPHHSFIPDDEEFGETYYGNKDDLTLLYNNVVLPAGWYLCDISNYYEDTTALEIRGGYYSPNNFILIIYDKVNTKYYLSEETNTYAFHSYFTFDMNDYNNDPISFNKNITLEPDYDYSKEVYEFFVRLIATLGIEMLLALAFRFTKESYKTILITNIATQIGLNLALNLTAYFLGKQPIMAILYFFIELIILFIEAGIYQKFCLCGKKQTKKLVPVYAALANLLSFYIGIALWFIL